jgi:hypothetical protein
MRHAITKRALVVFAVLALSFLTVQSSDSATIVINNNDGAGEGFNDPTVVSPVGGNPGTTLGAQRLNAFTYAANLWGASLQSSVTITVDAAMDPLTCTPTSAILGSAGATYIHRDFTGAPQTGTWYCQALANSLAGYHLNPGTADIGATFNSNLNGSPSCLGGLGWYYGYDQNPGSDIDFISVVFHEIGHGLGFQTFMSSAGVLLGGYDDTYERNLEHHFASPADYPSMTNAQRAAGNIGDPNLHWTGTVVNTLAPSILSSGIANGHVRMFGPNPYQPGSSVSHWSTAATPNLVMEPSYTGPNHNGTMELALFEDIGWTLTPPVNDVPATSNWGLFAVLLLVLATGAYMLIRRSRASSKV